jgi:hypothetical protein
MELRSFLARTHLCIFLFQSFDRPLQPFYDRSLQFLSRSRAIKRIDGFAALVQRNVADPVALALWFPRDNPSWSEERVEAAIHGSETLHVTLAKAVPVWIVYGTAVVLEDGRGRFFKDVCGQDAALEQELARARAMATAGELESLGIPADGAPAACIVALEKFDLPQTLFRLLKRSIRPA